MPEILATTSDGRTVDEALGQSCNEDTTLCGKSFSKERLAWYLYDAGNSAIGGVALLIFIPLLLSNLALDQAYSGAAVRSCSSHDGVSCNDDYCYIDQSPSAGLTLTDCTHCIQGEGLKLWDTSLQEFVGWSPPRVDFFGSTVDPTAFASLTISVSVAVQAAVYITFGAFADHSTFRYYGMLLASVMAQAAAICFIFMSSGSLYFVAALLTIALNAFFGVGGVFYNAYLPVLVDAHPRLKGYGGVEVPQTLKQFREELMDRMSGYGFMWGYAASVVVAVICFALLLLGIPIRVSVMVCGIWWALLTPIIFYWLKKRPGPALPKYRPRLLVVFHGWRSVLRTLRDVFRYRNTGIFLVCYFFYSDALSTMVYTAVLFAQEALCLGFGQQGIPVITILVTAALGNCFYVWIKTRLDLRTKTVLLIHLAVFALLNLYGCLSLIPNLPLGFRSSPEMYTYAAIFGFHIGAVQSFQRALFADLTIPGRETEFFSLYAITDRGSSWLGPLVVGIIRNFTGSLRGGFVYILLMIVLPSLGLAFFVDHDQGMIDVGRLLVETPMGMSDRADRQSQGKAPSVPNGGLSEP
ncbi:hypothetical protein FOZ62_031562 [Perkinsus olseni]|uniref:Autophagy-related protein n=1 Tax=Perkinsus olseni TaxID=32597 RepID=A0A7J6PSI2_PEROL|nr:hypothetical protein FOZ62_031562 [Perkinsus olseni]